MNYRRKTDLDSIYNLYKEGTVLRSGEDDLDSRVARAQSGRLGYTPGQISDVKSVDGRLEVSNTMLHHIIKELWHQTQDKKVKDPPGVLIYGEMGVGKTETVELASKELARENGREFVKSLDIDDQLASKIMQDPGKYWVFIDFATNLYEPQDLTGMPEITFDTSDTYQDRKYVRLKPMAWTRYLIEQPNLMGTLFLDEIGQATSSMRLAMQRTIQQRRIGDNRIVSNFMIVAATNLDDGLSGSETLENTLIGRNRVVQLVPNPREWAEWAKKNGVNDMVINFSLHKPEQFFYLGAVDYTGKPYPNPRSITKYGQWLKREEDVNGEFLQMDPDTRQYTIDIEGINMQQRPWLKNENNFRVVDAELYWKWAYNYAAASCGPDWANAFKIFNESYDELDLDEVLREPSQIQSADFNAHDFLYLCIKGAERIDKVWYNSSNGATRDMDADEAKDKSYKLLASKLHDPTTSPELNEMAKLLTYMSDDQLATFHLQVYNHSKASGILFHQYLLYGDLEDHNLKTEMVGEAKARLAEQIKSSNVDPDSNQYHQMLDQYYQIDLPADCIAYKLNVALRGYSSIK